MLAEYFEAGGPVMYVVLVAWIVVFAGVAFLLPTHAGPGNGTFTTAQAVGVSILILAAYLVFLALQTGPYRSHFRQPGPGAMRIPLRDARRVEATVWHRGARWRS